MVVRRLEEERVNEEVPPQVEKVEQVPQGFQGNQGARYSQVPILLGSNDVPVVSHEITNGRVERH